MIDYAHFIAPRAEAIHLSGDLSQILIQLLDWACDPAITGAFVATVLVTENLADLNRALVENPYSAKIADRPARRRRDRPATSRDLTAGRGGLRRGSPRCTATSWPAELIGLSRVNVRALVRRALAGDERLDHRLPDQDEQGADREGGRPA